MRVDPSRTHDYGATMVVPQQAPDYPWAVYLADRDLRFRLLAFDFDSSRLGPDRLLPIRTALPLTSTTWVSTSYVRTPGRRVANTSGFDLARTVPIRPLSANSHACSVSTTPPSTHPP